MFSRAGRMSEYHPHGTPVASRATQVSGRSPVQCILSQPAKTRSDIGGSPGTSTGIAATCIS